MIGATLFSGIGAPETAMPQWQWAWSAEIDKFASAVHAARHACPNLGNVTAHDFTARAAGIAAPDVLVFGSPCQSFSVAGRRLGLDDPRGNLALVALGIAARLRPRWLVFENVPGLLSSAGGRDFGIFVRTMEECGYFGAWRVLDAQYFGLAQRRERVFFVGCLGDWRGPAAVLFEPEGLRGDPSPSRKEKQEIAGTLSARPSGGGGRGTDFECSGGVVPILEATARQGLKTGRESIGIGSPGDPMFTLQASKQHAIAHTLLGDGGLTAYGRNNTSGPISVAAGLNARGGVGRLDFDTETFVTHTLRGDGFDASEDGTGRGTPIVPVAFRTSPNCGAWQTGDRTDALTTGTDHTSHVVAFQTRIARNGRGQPSEVVPALNGADAGATSDMRPCVATATAVRRLTPRECERLQGFPDDYTAIEYRGKPAADGPRYKALGNSMAVPVMRWILSRIERVDQLTHRKGDG